MTRRQKYLYSDTDRHGNRRWYFRAPGWKKHRIRHAEGTKEFTAEYKRLYALWEAADEPAPARVSQASVEWLCRQYMASQAFHSLARTTRTQRANFYQRFCRVHGEADFAYLSARDIAATRDAFGDRRFAARNFVKAMRALYAWASDPAVGLTAENPAAAVSLPSGQTEGHKRWTLDHVLQFKNHFKDGHRARIALALLLFTAQRISDVRRMGRGMVQGEWIVFRQTKTGNEVQIPLLPILKDELGNQFPNMLWWQNEYGRAFSEKSCSMRFSAYCKQAGLPPGYTAHGLRKVAPTMLAEMGVSEDTIMAITGHSSAEEARIYTRDAKRARLAEDGLRMFETEMRRVWVNGT